ncbi:hypothetical protein CNMCM5878_000475 [Aspergillus fumigatiaffinis]|nr:hypothetical protein CNMCM5878_000475 [Aspergillus fumigatiaffinis]
MGVDKEIEQLQATMATWDAQVKAQQQEIDIAAAEEQWLHTKYTSEQLYTLMESTNNTVSIASSWETCRDGLLSGEVLAIELQTLETVFDNTQPWDYEIYQSVSLRQINPHAFLELRETGSTSFELKEALFNQDFPGHYCRLLMETKVYFPGAPRYIACTLSLTTHKYRISAKRTSYAEHKDEDFRIDKIPITSVAATKSAGGSGLLQPTFHYMDEYFPFEGAGVLDINDSAIAGGDRQAALDAASKDLEVGSNVASIDPMNIEKPDKRQRISSGRSKSGPRSTSAITVYRTDLDGLKSVTAMISGTELDSEDAPMGAFVIKCHEGSIAIADSWKADLKLESAAWPGELDEAWLLISYAVTGLV